MSRSRSAALLTVAFSVITVVITSLTASTAIATSDRGPGAAVPADRHQERIADGEATVVVELPGVPGPYCAYGIEKELRGHPGVEGMTMDWDAEELRIRTTAEGLSHEEVERAVEASEYPYDYTIRTVP